MTSAAQASRRPTKPRRSPAVYVGLIAVVVITLLSVSEQCGIGLDLFAIIDDIGTGEPSCASC